MPGALSVWLLIVWLAGRAGAALPAPQPDPCDVQFGLSILLYIAADYAGAVGEDGALLSPSEYEEQVEFVGRVEELLGVGAQQVRPLLDALRQDVGARRPPGEIEARVRDLRASIMQVFQIEIAPQQMPSLDRGRKLYASSCVECHGEDGRARTERAQKLQPPPTDLHSPKLDANLSPARVFDVISFGIPGTAMASFETLEEGERWDLAFYVLALRHPNPPAGPPNLDFTLRDLAHSTDADLKRRLQHLPPTDRSAELARLRHALPAAKGD